MQALKTLTSLLLLASAASAQHPVGSLLTMVVDHVTAYRRDVTDLSLLATKPGPIIVSPVPPPNFMEQVIIGDMVSVNGRPVKGTLVAKFLNIRLGSDAAPGVAIADTTRTGWEEWNFEILD